MEAAATMKTFEQIIHFFERHADFVFRETLLLGQEVRVCYLQSLVDFPKTQDLLNQLQTNQDNYADVIHTVVVLTLGGRCDITPEEMIQSLLEGKLLIFPLEGYNNLLMDPSHPMLNRSISGPQHENVLVSSFDAFTESLTTNIGLLRTKFKTKDLMVKTYIVGKDNPCEVGLFYLENKANPKMIQQIIDRFEQGKDREAYNIQELTKVLNLPKFSLIPHYLSTELTAETMHNLLEGKAILLIDHFPVALSFPVIISDFWSVQIDKNHPYMFMLFFRIIRITGMMAALLIPALYVAIVSVNPEVLQLDLALSVAKNRGGVPYPALVEVLLMLLVLEMIMEASIRLPKAIGPTITMVGGIVLGQAVVEAKLVSNLLVIILAATTIANMTLAGFQNTVSIRLMKYVILFLSAIYGVIGIFAGVVWFCFYLAQIVTFQVPFLSFNMKDGTSDE